MYLLADRGGNTRIGCSIRSTGGIDLDRIVTISRISLGKKLRFLHRRYQRSIGASFWQARNP